MTQVSERPKTATIMALSRIENHSQRNFNVLEPRARKDAGFHAARRAILESSDRRRTPASSVKRAREAVYAAWKPT